MGDLSKCLPVTLQFEGGFSDNPKDPGGATMRGVTLATFRHYHPGATVEQLKAISMADLQAIYRDGYWAPIGGDNLPAGVDLAAFDYAVNSGPGEAKKAIAAASANSMTSVERVKAICARRLSLLHSLKTWAVFGKGWGARVAEVQALGIKWAAGPNATAELTKAAAEETAKAGVKKKVSTGALGGALATGVSPHVSTAAASAHPLLILGGVVALFAVGIAIALTIRKHENAADALTKAAKGA